MLHDMKYRSKDVGQLKAVFGLCNIHSEPHLKGLAAVLLPGTPLRARSKVYMASMFGCTRYLWRPFTLL